MNKFTIWCSSARGKRGRLIGGAVALLAVTTLIGAASTSSLFSDTHGGTITGGVGNVHITVSGGSGANGTDLSFGDNMLPGDASSVTLSYQNIGSGTEDVWIVFPNATALSALNSLGTYGEAHLTANGQSIFDSANLKDTAASCGNFTPNPTSQGPGCWPLLNKYKLGTIDKGGVGGFTFAFNYAEKLSGNPPAGSNVPWNSYPIPQGLWSPTNTGGQTYINASDGIGSGLPYALVATQKGHSPA